MKKTVFISGASRGIGKAIAVKFAKEGWNLALNCIHSIEELELLVCDLSSKYSINAKAYAADVGNSVQVRDMFHKISQDFTCIDVLINNAGISRIGLITDLSPDDWRHIMSTNLDSVFYCCNEVIPSMVSRQDGRIINIASIWGESGASCEAAYSASKGGMIAFTKALAKELAPSCIPVNAISPGVIDTEMNRCFSAEEKFSLAEDIPAGRFGSCEEVADTAYFLATAPKYLTGQILGINGGWF